MYNKAQKGTDGHITRATGALTLWHIVGGVGRPPFHSEVNPYAPLVQMHAPNKQDQEKEKRYSGSMRITQARHIRKAPA